MKIKISVLKNLVREAVAPVMSTSRTTTLDRAASDAAMAFSEFVYTDMAQNGMTIDDDASKRVQTAALRVKSAVKKLYSAEMANLY